MRPVCCLGPALNSRSRLPYRRLAPPFGARSRFRAMSAWRRRLACAVSAGTSDGASPAVDQIRELRSAIRPPSKGCAYNDDCAARFPAGAADEIANLLRALQVEAAHGFVEGEDWRITQHSPSQAQSLVHPRRILGDELLGVRRETDEVEARDNSLPGRRGGRLKRPAKNSRFSRPLRCQ